MFDFIIGKGVTGFIKGILECILDCRVECFFEGMLECFFEGMLECFFEGILECFLESFFDFREYRNLDTPYNNPNAPIEDIINTSVI
jgi:hypothetical protein|tara:strand:- start:913 stop:1173 length:261 start_codon:yes stop_codon:yes gene_type:complete